MVAECGCASRCHSRASTLKKNASAVGLVDDAEEAGIARHEIPAAIGEWLHGDAVAKYDVVADDAAGVSEDTVPGNRRARAPGPGRRS